MDASKRVSTDAETVRRHGLLFAVLYFSEGAPIGFVWWAMPTLLTDAGAKIDDVTALSALLVLPWALKFLWAPLVDAWQTPFWTLRHWIVAAQVAMATSLIPLWSFDWASDLSLLRAALLVHAFAAATQDVAIDAWCISITDESERGRINGWMQAGMLVGRSLLGGGALILAARFGVGAVLGLLLSCILVPAVFVLTARPGAALSDKEHNVAVSVNESRGHRFLRTLRHAASLLSTWLGLAFALTAGAAFEFLGAVQGPLLRSRGWSSESVGWLLAVPVVICMIGGSLLGGRLSDKLEHGRVAAFSLVLIMAHVAAVGVVSLTVTRLLSSDILPVLLCTEALCVGSFTASSYALLMDLCHPRIAGTQFSAFMAATNGCEAWAVAVGGMLIASQGYGPALLSFAGLSVPGLIVLSLLRRTRSCSTRR